MNRRWFLQLLTGAAVAPFVPVPDAAIDRAAAYEAAVDAWYASMVPVSPLEIICLDEMAPVSPLLFEDAYTSRYLTPAVEHMRDERDRRIAEFASILTDGRSAFSLTKS